MVNGMNGAQNVSLPGATLGDQFDDGDYDQNVMMKMKMNMNITKRCCCR